MIAYLMNLFRTVLGWAVLIYILTLGEPSLLDAAAQRLAG